MSNNQKLIEENKKLKSEVELYQKGYENILTEKLMIEQEYENFKLAIQESRKTKSPNILGTSTIVKAQEDNIKYKSEIDEYLSTIWELQTNLSQKEEEIRVLTEKNKKLENELKNLQNENEKFNQKKKPSINEENKNNNLQQSIFDMEDLYKSTVISKTKIKIKNKIKNSVNNIIPEEEIDKKNEEEEKERKRKEEAEFEKRRKEEEMKQKKLLEEAKMKKEIENKIKEYNNNNKDLNKKFEEIKQKTIEYYKDIENQKIYIDNYKTFINEINEEINKLKDQININLYEISENEEKNGKNNKITEFINYLETISVKIKQLNNIVDDSKNVQLKKVESIQNEVQEKFLELNEEKKKDDNLITLKNIYETNNNFISNKLKELGQLIELLSSNKKTSDSSRKGIEDDINKLKKDLSDYVEKIKKAKTILMANRNKKEQNGPFIDSIFLKGSMLIGINDFKNAKSIFDSTNIFVEDKDENLKAQDLLRKNWNEVCYVYEDYDIHDINYELKAVGLPPNTFFTSCSIGFVFDTDVEILEFEKDGKKEEYKYESYSLEFKIHLTNLQSNKIHLKYKESPLKSKMTEGEKKERKFVKNNYYGLSKNTAGQNGKFTLSIKCDFEVISFEDEFFVKTNEKEYTWGGKVPPGGKRTYVKMSKTQGKFKFLCSEVIQSKNTENIKSTKMTAPVIFIGGNNEVLKHDFSSEQTDKIELKKEERVYEINFLNTNSKRGEFKIEGELVNRCKGEWVCDLTDKQIEDQIPKDYKSNKSKFKEFAEQIIKNYDKENKDNLVKVPDVVKIGKWIKKNIKYDLSYSGRNDITATETLNNRIGVCHHFTKAFNALMYSLGYQVIYISGYALDKKDTFEKEDAHAWSLIKIDGKWLPFDSTWGIFSGKLPVCHVFKQFFSNGVKILGTDKIEFGKGKDEGKYLDN